ncbi:hypothetical protein MMC06_004259 [Schaereria dolodes]|nr:hypothetical protein [Schaereria dolodes]
MLFSPYTILYLVSFVIAHPTEEIINVIPSLDRRTDEDGPRNPPDISYSNFEIVYCGTNGEDVENVLIKVIAAIAAAHIDISTGVQPKHGFKAFFKTAENADFVMDLLGRMRNEASMPTNQDPSTRVTILCARNDGVSYELNQLTYKFCVEDPYLPAYVLGYWKFVILCPYFFQIPAAPYKSGCPTYNPATDTIQGIIEFAEYQSYTLVAGLMRLYTSGTP